MPYFPVQSYCTKWTFYPLENIKTAVEASVQRLFVSVNQLDYLDLAPTFKHILKAPTLIIDHCSISVFAYLKKEIPINFGSAVLNAN